MDLATRNLSLSDQTVRYLDKEKENKKPIEHLHVDAGGTYAVVCYLLHMIMLSDS